MIKIALFCDTDTTHGGVLTYCMRLKALLESLNKNYSITIFSKLKRKTICHFHFYDRKAIKSALLSDNYDIIHINGFASTLPFYVTSVMKKIGIKRPIVYTPHAHPFYTLNYPLIKRVFFHLFVKKVLKSAGVVISINNEDHSFFQKFNKNVVKIPHWTDGEIKQYSKKKEDKPTILFVGRNDDNKNLKALYSLPIDKYNVICVTNIKPDREDFMFKTKISDEELKTLYIKASIVIVPSRYEAFSYSALESLSVGTPILISNRVRIADFLEGVSGYTTFDYEQPSDLLNKIDFALTQTVDTEKVKRIFSKESAFSSYSNIYNQLFK